LRFETISNKLRHEYIIKKSRFICDLMYCSSLENVKIALNNIKNEFPDATHHCYAYIGLPGSNEFEFKDDGEPSGTAGMPILNALKINGLEGVLAVITRYFGGIKLGATGLSAAYAKATQEAISKAKKVEAIYSLFLTFSLDYSTFEMLKANKNLTYDIVEIDYGQEVNITVAVPKENFEDFKNLVYGLTSSQFEVSIIKEDYHYY
jgi:uncharacterized YigZ family protein